MMRLVCLSLHSSYIAASVVSTQVLPPSLVSRTSRPIHPRYMSAEEHTRYSNENVIVLHVLTLRFSTSVEYR